MTILQALDSYYHRLKGVAEPGRSAEKFGWCIVLDRDGGIVDVEDLRDLSGKKPLVRLFQVPASFPRPGVTPRAFFLWDKTAFSLGVTKSKAGKGWEVSRKQFDAFRALHLERLAGQEDEGLKALRRFVEKWEPDRFGQDAAFTPEMLDANIMFRLEGEQAYLHERGAVSALLTSIGESAEAAPEVFCLVTGDTGPVARLHPTIKGVDGAQSSGAALVSFNLDAFTSLGKEQGANAPTSEAAAFRYGTALNQLLTRDGPNRLRRPIGDATVVFWADASNARAAEAADAFMGILFAGDITDASEAEKVRREMDAIAKGRPVADLRAEIEPGTRFHVLGLSPNAARLSVRFWLSDTLDHFAQRLARHYEDLKLDPPPQGWGAAPSVNRLLANSTALQGEFKNIPSQLAGEVMRAVLSGERYPQSLLATAIMRLRSGGDLGRGWHVAAIRAVLARDARLSGRDGIPMGLNKDSTDQPYRLGRLFAALEYVQEQAIEGVKATIRSRFLASASAAPASVFPTLLRLSQHHIVKLTGLAKGGLATFHDKQIQEILEGVPDHFPRSLRLAEQGRFYIGYYHQRAERFRKRDGKGTPVDGEGNDDGE